MKKLFDNIKDIFKKQSKELEELSMDLNEKLKIFIEAYLKKNKVERSPFLIVGIRNEEGLKEDVINDFLGYLDEELFLVKGTTDPSVYWTTSKERNKKGTFHLKTGYHKRIWCVGIHKGYEAFVNNWKYCLPTEGWRDSDYNFEYNNKDVLVKDYFGINFHRMHPLKIVDRIGKYSGGCQVVNDNKDLQHILKRFKSKNLYKKNKYATVDYMLFDLNELPKDIQKELYA